MAQMQQFVPPGEEQLLLPPATISWRRKRIALRSWWRNPPGLQAHLFRRITLQNGPPL